MKRITFEKAQKNAESWGWKLTRLYPLVKGCKYKLNHEDGENHLCKSLEEVRDKVADRVFRKHKERIERELSTISISDIPF
jgi:hypothetical protein